MKLFNKFFEVSCKKATFLASKKEEKKTSFFDGLKLKLHYKICDSCNLFNKQTLFIGKNARHSHQHTDVLLREEKKEEIKGLIRLQK